MTDPIPMPFGGKDVPHLLIEVNQACNLTCKACYKDKFGYTKPLPQVLDEIDLAVEQRNLDMITLAGGEPTLHPDLPAIIAHVTEKGIKTSLLTNGTLLTDERLRKYREAGLTRVALHVDTQQHRPDAPPGATSERDLNPLRTEIFERVARHGIHFGLVATLYQSNLRELPGLIEYALQSRHVSLVLMTCCKDLRPIVEALGHPDGPSPDDFTPLLDEEVTCDEVAEILDRELDLQPLHYIESDRRVSEKRWLLYLGFVITGSDGAMDRLFLSSRYRRLTELANTLQKTFKGRYKFDMVPGRVESVLVTYLYGLMGLDLRNYLSSLRFLSGLLRPRTAIHSKVFVFQQPPNLTADGQVELCKNCPDATIRNGQVVPVCMADILSPVVERDAESLSQTEIQGRRMESVAS